MADQATFFKPPKTEARSSALSLPPDLLEKSRRRVQLVAILALIGFGLDVVISLVARLIELFTGSQFENLGMGVPSLSGSLIAILASVAMIVTVHHRRFHDETVLVLGLAFEVLLCGIISIINPWAAFSDTGQVPRLTWITPLIIMFPLIIPVRPKITAITALVAASTAPLGLMYLHQTGKITATTDDFIATAFGPLVAAMFAIIAARVVYELGINVTRARQLGSYQLEEKIGAGGMGEVWKAKHSLLVRPAAVKLIHPGLSGADLSRRSEMLSRFEREAQATSMMRSPHTVALYDFGCSSEGAFYYVMELLDGLDADRLVRRFGPVEPARAVHLLRQVCDSLLEAHEQDLIHRDIKPANIYVCRHGRWFDFIKVLDFGLVKSLAQAKDSDANLTAQNVAAGTPAYMSPEQILGKNVDGRSDLYAVGCVAFWLLTGRSVFQGATPMEIINQHVNNPPVAPSQLSELSIPVALDSLVLECLEKDPAKRPQNAGVLDEALSTVLGETSWTQAQARRWWESHYPAVPGNAASSDENA